MVLSGPGELRVDRRSGEIERRDPGLDTVTLTEPILPVPGSIITEYWPLTGTSVISQSPAVPVYAADSRRFPAGRAAGW